MSGALAAVRPASAAPPQGDWVAAPALDEAALEGTFWTFGRLGGPRYTRFLVLAPDGRIGNYFHPNEQMWQVLDGSLRFVSDTGIANTPFAHAEMRAGAVAALCGQYRDTEIWHELRRVAHPAHPLAVSPPHVERRAVFLKAPARPLRPNLVVLRAGETSLHRAWTRDIPEDDRNWDLCISHYGASPDEVRGDAEYLTQQPKQRKFQALYDLFHEDSPLWGYERVWFPDDDLMTGWRDINRAFHLSRMLGLDLSQPSLARRPDCFITHDVTAQRENSLVRHPNFVEVMCPMFTARALRVCLGSFRDSVFGFGLDHLWPSLLGAPRPRIGILDAVSVVHTRPFAANYALHDAQAEERAILSAYQFAPCP